MRDCRTRAFSRTKIKHLKDLEVLCSRLKAQGKKIVFTNGCFDILHYGHVRYLEEARQYGDLLIVGVNSDSSVRRLKGTKRPIVPQRERVGIIAALSCVDYALLFHALTPLSVIKRLKPDILVKGADWSSKIIVGAGEVSTYGGRVATVRLVRGRSTTNVIKTIAQRFCK